MAGEDEAPHGADGSSDSAGAPDPHEAPASPEAESVWAHLLERADALVYGVVGLAFLAGAVFSLAIGLYAAGDQVLTQMFAPTGFSLNGLAANGLGAQDVIALVSDLLLTLIIMEVLGTVIHHLRERETTLRPFLFIGIISATRGILAVGARITVSQTLTQDEFLRDMVELGVNAVVIIALGVAMKLIGTFLDEGATARRRQRPLAVTEVATSPRRSSVAPRTSQAFVLPAILATMVLIVLVALTLIGILVASGRF
jgi:uncharacterized membrane protein (DUF373 family)